MRALHRAEAGAHGRADYPLRREHVREQAGAHHVGHGVHCADLVEMDLPYLAAVYAALRAGYGGVDRPGAPLDALGDVEAVYNGAYVRKGVVVMPRAVVSMTVRAAGMRLAVPGLVLVAMAVPVGVLVSVSMAMLLLVLAADGDGDAAARYAALDGGQKLDVYAGDTEGVHALDERGPLPLRQQLQKGGGEHVARHAHAAVQIKYPHIAPHRWFIMLAR